MLANAMGICDNTAPSPSREASFDRIRGREKSGCARTTQFSRLSLRLMKAVSHSGVQSSGLSFLKVPAFTLIVFLSLLF